MGPEPLLSADECASSQKPVLLLSPNPRIILPTTRRSHDYSPAPFATTPRPARGPGGKFELAGVSQGMALAIQRRVRVQRALANNRLQEVVLYGSQPQLHFQVPVLTSRHCPRQADRRSTTRQRKQTTQMRSSS